MSYFVLEQTSKMVGQYSDPPQQQPSRAFFFSCTHGKRCKGFHTQAVEGHAKSHQGLPRACRRDEPCLWGLSELSFCPPVPQLPVFSCSFCCRGRKSIPLPRWWTLLMPLAGGHTPAVCCTLCTTNRQRPQPSMPSWPRSWRPCGN